MSLFRRIINRIRRPASVTRAQHHHVARHPSCAACGSEVSVQAHHIDPYNKFPSMASNPDNFISLCEGVNECHLKVGHGGNWHYYNPTVVQDAADFRQANDVARKLILSRIKCAAAGGRVTWVSLLQRVG